MKNQGNMALQKEKENSQTNKHSHLGIWTFFCCKPSNNVYLLPPTHPTQNTLSSMTAGVMLLLSPLYPQYLQQYVMHSYVKMK